MVFKKFTPLFKNLICLSLVAIVLFSASFPAFAIQTDYTNYYNLDSNMYGFLDTFPVPFVYNNKSSTYDRFVVFYSSIDNNYYAYYYNSAFCSVDFSDFLHPTYGELTTLLITCTPSEMSTTSSFFGFGSDALNRIYSYLRSGLFIWTGSGWVPPSSYVRQDYYDYPRIEQVYNNTGQQFYFALTYNTSLSPDIPYLTCHPISFNSTQDVSQITFSTLPDGTLNYKSINTYTRLGKLNRDCSFDEVDGTWSQSALSLKRPIFTGEIPNAYIGKFHHFPDWSVDVNISNEDILSELTNFFNYNPVTNGFILLSNIISYIFSITNLHVIVMFIFALTILAIIYGRR